MKKYVVGLCGNFNENSSFLNGQVIRSLSILRELRGQLGNDSVHEVSYHNWKSNPFSVLFQFLKLAKNSKNLILFPDLRAVNFLVPIAVAIKSILKVNVFYNVIGGWLPEYIEKYKFMRLFMRRLDGLFVQTNELKEELSSLGLTNVTIFPNFKHIKVYQKEELPKTDTTPLKLVFMSRVTEKKGIRQLVEIVRQINSEVVIYSLDIYGSIQDDFKEEFNRILKELPPYIRYCGQVEPDKTSETMKNYFLHVFPTLYKTEGYPGSVLDAFCAGVPTLASRWNSCSDVLDEGIDSITYTLGNWDEMKEKLVNIASSPESIVQMRTNCLRKAEMYRPEKIIQIMIQQLKHGEKTI